jgi:DNA polymerase-3 subunit epsilon
VTPLSQLEVFVLDCQATAAAPRGRLLELGWARVGATTADPRACLIALPEGAHLPAAVARITGITEPMARGGVDAATAWRALVADAAGLGQQPAPTIVHYARFEAPFLRALSGGGPLSLDLVCTHEIACRLLPELPRRGLRALAGYFGRAVGELRRSADHVDATAFVWRELVPLLAAEGVTTWRGLRGWLAEPRGVPEARRRIWPMPREVRLAVPDAPGIYRMLRTSGDVLYVGKAASLRHRVNSYFRKQSDVPERTLEMLSQARAISFAVTPSALEAALLEPDEIKRHQPPYNVALSLRERALWFASADLSARSSGPSPDCPLGPFTSSELLDDFAALARAEPTGRWAAPADAVTFDEGYRRLARLHPELSRRDVAPHARLLRLGARLWREGRRNREAEDETAIFRVPDWSPEAVQAWLEWIALRAAHACRRASWLTALLDSTLVWSEAGLPSARLLVIEGGEIVSTGPATSHAVAEASPPIPPGHGRPIGEKRQAFSLHRYDRLTVLTSELKRMTATGLPLALRLGAAAPLTGARLASALAWV